MLSQESSWNSTLSHHYTNLYNTYKNDSPNKSRTRMVAKLNKEILESREPLTILDIGSGPHAIERELKSRLGNYIGRFCVPKIFTVDIADIKTHKLIQGKINEKIFSIFHTRGNASNLPFKRNIFDLVFSNLAIDFAPRKTFEEVYYSLKSGGKCIFHFHHPMMIPDDLSVVKNDTVRTFWTYLKEKNHLFQSTEQIETYFQNLGFTNIQVKEKGDFDDLWWEVSMEVVKN